MQLCVLGGFAAHSFSFMLLKFLCLDSIRGYGFKVLLRIYLPTLKYLFCNNPV